jgi:predicted neuraminidase
MEQGEQIKMKHAWTTGALFVLAVSTLPIRGLPALPPPPPGAVALSEFIEPAPPVEEVHASTITEVSPGVFLAAWFGGAKEADDDTQIYGAFRKAADAGWGKSFVIEKGLSPDGSKPEPVYNPSLYTHADGRVTVFYMVGPWGGSVRYCMKDSEDGGVTWGPERPVPNKRRASDRAPTLRLDDGSLLYPTTTPGGGVRCDWSDEAMSPASWGGSDTVADPQKFKPIQPTLMQKADGTVLMFARTFARQIAVTRSGDRGRTWSPLKGTGHYMVNSGIDVLKLKDGRAFLVYNKSDKPENPPRWGPRVPLTLALSADDGETWRDLFNLETEDIRDGYAYPTLIQASDDLVHLTYTWGRKRIKHVVIDPEKIQAVGVPKHAATVPAPAVLSAHTVLVWEENFDGLAAGDAINKNNTAFTYVRVARQQPKFPGGIVVKSSAFGTGQGALLTSSGFTSSQNMNGVGLDGLTPSKTWTLSMDIASARWTSGTRLLILMGDSKATGGGKRVYVSDAGMPGFSERDIAGQSLFSLVVAGGQTRGGGLLQTCTSDGALEALGPKPVVLKNGRAYNLRISANGGETALRVSGLEIPPGTMAVWLDGKLAGGGRVSTETPADTLRIFASGNSGGNGQVAVELDTIKLQHEDAP